MADGRRDRVPWVKLRKVGNSFVVTVPRTEVDRLGLREGDPVVVEVRRLDVRPRDEVGAGEPDCP